MGLFKQKFNAVSGQFNLVPSGTIITFKDGVANVASLPATGNTLNDARITDDTGHLYVWNGTSWVDQGDIIDLEWSAINGKPSSSVADIDDAVSKRHTQNTDLYLGTQVTNTLYVDNKRIDTYTENGSITKPFKTIQAAIDAVAGGTSSNRFIIRISPGANYTEAINMNKDYVALVSDATMVRLTGAMTIDSLYCSFTHLQLRGTVTLNRTANFNVNIDYCILAGAGWAVNATAPLGNEYIQIHSGIVDAPISFIGLAGVTFQDVWIQDNLTFTNAVGVINGILAGPITVNLETGAVVSVEASQCEPTVTVNLKTGAILNGNSDFISTANIVNTGGTLNLTTKASGVKNDSTVTGTTVKDALDNLESKSHDHPITHNLYVDKNRVDVYVEDGSFTKPFKTIQASIDAATGATVYNRINVNIAPGEYVEQLVMKNWVHLIALIPDSVWVKSAVGDVLTTSVDANITNIIFDYAGSDNSKVAIKCNNGAILVMREVSAVGTYTGVEVNSGAIVISYGGGTLTGEADSFVVKNGGYVAFYSTTLAGWGAPYYDLTIEAGGYVDVMDVQLYNERLNNLGTLNLVTPASRIKNDSTVVGTTVKDALEHLDSVKLEDAPSDGKTYGRKDAAWAEVTGGGGGATISNISTSISFSAEQTKDFDISAGANSLNLVMGRLYISANPGAVFFDNPTISFYSHSDRKDDQILFMATVPLIFTTFASGSGPGGNSVPTNDASHFVMSDLMYLFGLSNEFRRILTISGNNITTISALVNAYLASDGVSNVAEFSNPALYDSLSASKIYARISFTAAKTVDVKLDLTVRT